MKECHGSHKVYSKLLLQQVLTVNTLPMLKFIFIHLLQGFKFPIEFPPHRE